MFPPRTIMTRSQTALTPMPHVSLPDTVRRRIRPSDITTPDARATVAQVASGALSGMPPRHPGLGIPARGGAGAPALPPSAFVTPVRDLESSYGAREELPASLLHANTVVIDDLLMRIEGLINDKGLGPEILPAHQKALQRVKELYAGVITDTNQKIAKLNKVGSFPNDTLLRLRGEKGVMKLWETTTDVRLVKIQARFTEGCLEKCFRRVVSVFCTRRK